MGRIEPVDTHLRHHCSRCGGCCEGLKAQLHPDEHAGVLACAEKLGVTDPINGRYLRQVDNRCVFYDRGCRIHAELGPSSKPHMCRQFPFVYLGGEAGIDPSCFNADPAPEGEGPDPDLMAKGGPRQAPERRTTLPWHDLEHGHLVRHVLSRVPQAQLLAEVGSMARALLVPILTAEPAVPHPFYFEDRVRTALRFGLVDTVDPVRALVGGCQLVAGSGVPPGTGFAAFMRLLRTGPI